MHIQTTGSKSGWPLIEKKPTWSVGYLVCLIPVTLIQSAMGVLNRK